MTPKYSMLIRWSEEDQVSIAWLPEFGDFTKTHGGIYEEAARMGNEALEVLIEAYHAEGKPLPPPRLYDAEETAIQATQQVQ